MNDLERLPKSVQVQVRMSSLILALKKTLVNTPELEELFTKNYNDALKEYDVSKLLESDQ